LLEQPILPPAYEKDKNIITRGPSPCIVVSILLLLCACVRTHLFNDHFN